MRALLYILAAAAVLAAAFIVLRRAPAGLPPSSAPAADRVPAAPENREFMGRHGYMLKLPPNYTAVSSFADSRKTQEVVYLAPAGTDPGNFLNEGLYGPLGILRLEVRHRETPQGTVTPQVLKAGVLASLQARKAAYTVKDLEINGLAGFSANVSAPFQSAQAFLVGGRHYYVLTGGPEEGAFMDVLTSLHETAEGNPEDAGGN